jgi:hypothetical protein
LGCFLLPINWLSILSVIGLGAYYLLNFIDDILNKFFEFKMINFEMNIGKMNLSSLFFGINYVSVILFFITIYSVIVLFFGLKVCNEKINLKKNFFYYSIYLVLYSSLQSIFWITSFLNKIFIRNKNEGWKYGKTQS